MRQFVSRDWKLQKDRRDKNILDSEKDQDVFDILEKKNKTKKDDAWSKTLLEALPGKWRGTGNPEQNIYVNSTHVLTHNCLTTGNCHFREKLSNFILCLSWKSQLKIPPVFVTETEKDVGIFYYTIAVRSLLHILQTQVQKVPDLPSKSSLTNKHRSTHTSTHILENDSLPKIISVWVCCELKSYLKFLTDKLWKWNHASSTLL